MIWSMVIFFISAPICLWATGDIKIAVFAGGAYILLIMIPATIGNLDFDKNMVPVIENLEKKMCIRDRNKGYKAGIGMIPRDNDESGVEKVIIPQYRKRDV